MNSSTSALSQLSPKRYPREAFVWWQSLLFVLTLFVVYVVPSAVVGAFLLVFKLATLHDFTVVTWPFVVAQIAVYVTCVAMLVLGLPALAHRSLPELGLRAPRWTDLLWGIAGATGMLIAASLVAAGQETFFHLKADEVQVHLLRATHGPLLAGFAFIACVGAPIFEELTFRGFLFNAMLRYAPAWAATILSASLFGLAHWLPGNAGAILPLIAMGLVLAVVYYRSGSLVASMLTHALFNAFTVLGIALGFAK